jgi:RNA polymerase sigma-70 factor (ECF subfamily)
MTQSTSRHARPVNSSMAPADGASRPNRHGQQFVELLGRHERDLFGYVFAMAANWDDAQEIMQRLRIRIWEQFDQYDPARPFGAWARAIAYYLVLAFRKEKSRQREYFTERILQLLDETYEATGGQLADSRDALVECLGKLSVDKQKLVTEYYSPGGPAALERSSGKTANALRQAVHRIRRLLHDCVDRRVAASER